MLQKTLPKSAKVCFQTPMRDPVTRKIVTPCGKVDDSLALDDCAEAFDSLSLESSPAISTDTLSFESKETVSVDQPKSDASLGTTERPYPDDEMPIQSNGGYSIDYDNLDAFDPFKSSSEIGTDFSELPVTPGDIASETSAQASTEELPSVDTVSALDDTLSLENSLKTEVTSGQENADSPVVIKERDASKFDVLEDVGDKEGPEVPKQSYSLDLDHLENAESFCSSAQVQNSPLAAKSSYTIDFDKLDDIDPFKTGGPKLQNSPVCNSRLPNNMSPVLPEEPIKLESAVEMFPAMKKEPCASTDASPLVKAEDGGIPSVIASPSTNAPVAGSSSTHEDAPNGLHGSEGYPEKPTTEPSPVKDGPVRLEFNFDDGEVKCKPPPRKLGKRPLGAKATVKKPAAAAEKKDEPKSLSDHSNPSEDLPKASYNFDFEKFDANFNPFVTGSKINNSPDISGPVAQAAAAAAAAEIIEGSLTSLEDEPEKVANSDGPDMETLPAAEVKSPEKIKMCVTPPENKSHPLNTTGITIEESFATSQSTEERTESFQHNNMAFNLDFPSNEFKPGTCFNEQFDYLEQFGSTFKESALRKQSLYLKFDPLLRESPQKLAPRSAEINGFPLPPLFASRLEAQKAGAELKEQTREEKVDGLIFLESFSEAAADPLGTSVLGSLVPDFPLPGTGEDAIIDVLKYSQKDMDAAIEQVHLKVQEKENIIADMQEKYEKLRMDYNEVEKVVSGFEATAAQIMDQSQKQQDAAKLEIQKVMQEKQQVIMDLNSVEKSFSDLFKRFEKQKEVLEGYKKNEETLKKCAQDYLARIKKEEQRYQTLKAHAEEKMKLANEEIAQVRSKLKSEGASFHAQLCRQQLKIQALEKNLEQKVKENEELTKLCDELIVNVQKT
ncbi:transforming acidic coiled-coil-containing protein 3 isoform X2 [Amia ocellicauda]